MMVATVAAPALPAGADSVKDKQAQAARLAHQIDAQGAKLEQLSERYNAAVLKQASVRDQLAKAQATLDATLAKAAGARSQLRAQAVSQYVNGSSFTSLATAGGDGGDPLLKREYAETMASTQADALDGMRAASLDLKDKQAALLESQKAADAAVASVNQAKADALKAQSDLQSTLGSVKGDLADLVAQQQAAAAQADTQRATAQITRSGGQAPAAAPKTPTRAAAPSKPTVINAPPNGGAKSAVAAAIAQIGKPYVFGAGGPNSFDCSGLTSYAWRYGGVSLPHNAAAQYSATRHIPVSQAQPGDLFFFGSDLHHVGIYVGGGTMVEAPQTGMNVRYASAYRSDLVGVGRP